jgi:hypothetical protein
MRCLRSWLRCVSQLRSFHCHQVRSKREGHLPFAARFAGDIRPRINSRETSILIGLFVTLATASGMSAIAGRRVEHYDAHVGHKERRLPTVIRKRVNTVSEILHPVSDCRIDVPVFRPDRRQRRNVFAQRFR